MGTLRRHLEVWRAAWRERHRDVRARRSPGEIEFLPAVLELQETPPSPVGRAVGATIIGVFLVGVVWASVGEIDIVAVARGRIIPSGHSKVIQPFESGVVRAIHVKDGMPVTKGAVLIELDPTQSVAEQERLMNEYQAARLEAARLRALIGGQAELEALPGAPAELVALQARRLREQRTEYESRVQAARHLIAQRRAALDATNAMIARLKATVPMLEEQAEAYRRLVEQRYVSRVEFLAVEKARVEERQELVRQRNRLQENAAALAQAEEDFEALVSRFQQERHAELSRVETQVASLAQDIVKAEERSGRQRLGAPIDGVVQELAIHTVGGVVTPAQRLMVLVPREQRLEVEAWVENKDVGFVEAGQPVEIKVDSFPFTRFGAIPGRIVTVSRDAVPLDGRALAYATRVAMARATMRVRDKEVNLSPGMAVRVEIKTGTRRLIEFFLSPLLRGLHETARER